MLSFTTKFGGFLSVVALAIGFSGAADAATLTWSVRPPVVGASPIANNSTGDFRENEASNIPGVRRNPWGHGSTNVYNSVSNGHSEYDFSVLQGALSFVWGTPDKFNSVEFFRGGNLVDKIVGDKNANNYNSLNSLLLATDIGDGGGYDRVRFVSTGISFEHASIKFVPLASVPLPATGLLLLTTLGAVAALRSRKLV